MYETNDNKVTIFSTKKSEKTKNDRNEIKFQHKQITNGHTQTQTEKSEFTKIKRIKIKRQTEKKTISSLPK